MSLWFPIARSYSRSIYTSRCPLILPSPFRLLPPPQQLVVLPRYQSSKTTPATTDSKAGPPASKEPSQQPVLSRAWKKVKHEAQHYWHGTKLLVSEVRISSRLQWKILHGDTLTRRERRQASNPYHPIFLCSR